MKNIGLFGFGIVARGFYHALQSNPTVAASIKTICVKDESKIREHDHLSFTCDPEDILSDPDIDIVIELIDDADAAYSIVKSALLAGKDVISANKKNDR